MASVTDTSLHDRDRPAPKPPVLGVGIDRNTRCAHYRSDSDIIAIKIRCCGEFYACKECHDELAGHPLQQWAEAEYETRAILCGKCDALLTISEYLASGSRCPKCDAAFNPRCSLHHHHYFGGKAK